MHLLARDVFLPFLRKHAMLFDREGMDAAVEYGVSVPDCTTWAAAFSAHTVVRLAKMVGDSRWGFGRVCASASNRVWRDWERKRVAGFRPGKVPDKSYHQQIGGERGYIVARMGGMELIDMNMWRWRDPECRVCADQICWAVFTEDSDFTGLSMLENAEWGRYVCTPMKSGEVVAETALSEEVGLRIDEMLRGLELELPK